MAIRAAYLSTWRSSIRDAEYVVNIVVLIYVLHHLHAIAREAHGVQMQAFFVVVVLCLRAVAHLAIGQVAVLIVLLALYQRLLVAIFFGGYGVEISAFVIRITNHLSIGVGHGVNAVPAVVVSLPDVGADIGLGKDNRLDGLRHLSQFAVVVCLATAAVLYEFQASCAVVA